MPASQNHQSGFHIRINNSAKVSIALLPRGILSLSLEAHSCGRSAEVSVQLLNLVLNRVGDVDVLGACQRRYRSSGYSRTGLGGPSG